MNIAVVVVDGEGRHELVRLEMNWKEIITVNMPAEMARILVYTQYSGYKPTLAIVTIDY